MKIENRGGLIYVTEDERVTIINPDRVASIARGLNRGNEHAYVEVFVVGGQLGFYCSIEDAEALISKLSCAVQASKLK